MVLIIIIIICIIYVIMLLSYVLETSKWAKLMLKIGRIFIIISIMVILLNLIIFLLRLYMSILIVLFSSLNGLEIELYRLRLFCVISSILGSWLSSTHDLLYHPYPCLLARLLILFALRWWTILSRPGLPSRGWCGKMPNLPVWL